MAEESFAWAIWSTTANAAWIFLYVFSISIAYVAGKFIIHPIILAVFAYLIPGFSFGILPVVLILFTAILNKRVIL